MSTPKARLEENTVESPGDKYDLGNAISSSSDNQMNRKQKSIFDSDHEGEQNQLAVGPSL